MPFAKASRFFGHDVWVENLDELPGWRAALYRLSRVLYLAGRGFMYDSGLHRSSALAFDTVLGLIPFLAFIVATLKGFGSYEKLMAQTVRPWVEATLASMGDPGDTDVVNLHTTFRTVFGLLDRTDFGALGILGLIALLYIAVLMLVSIESSMNHIFGAVRSRGVTRRISDYSAILFITPVCVTIAAAVTATARRVDWPFAGIILQITSIMAMAFALTMLYLVMPFGKVRVRSAVFGGAVAGVLWYLTLLLHIHFQIGVARYNAMYSTFAAVPLFFIWVFLSWVVVIFGAELTGAHQNSNAFRWRVCGDKVDQSGRQYVALRCVLAITDAFMHGRPALMLSELASLSHAPDKLVEEILDMFVTHGILARAEQSMQPSYLPARDLNSIRVSTLLEALDRSPSVHAPIVDFPEGASVSAVLAEMNAARVEAPINYTLTELVSHARRRDLLSEEPELSKRAPELKGEAPAVASELPLPRSVTGAAVPLSHGAAVPLSHGAAVPLSRGAPAPLEDAPSVAQATAPAAVSVTHGAAVPLSRGAPAPLEGGPSVAQATKVMNQR